MSIQLPQNISLLSDKELEDLTTNHKPKLSQYVKQYQSDNIDTIAKQTKAKKDQLLALKERYSQLEKDRGNLNKELEAVKLLHSQYVAKYQNLETIFKEQYSEDAFKLQLNRAVAHLDNESNTLKGQILSLTDMDQLDSLLEKYRNKRTQYHYSKEQLTTWEEQGYLRR
ncbi:protein Srn2p [Monosporozyma unispora]|nr:hypothetical protein C6P44_001824 [Kazachstania unispora]